jgi:hypothetical protein
MYAFFWRNGVFGRVLHLLSDSGADAFKETKMISLVQMEIS